MTMKIVLTYILTFLCFHLYGQEGWELKKNEDDIQVFIRDNDSVKLKEYQAITKVSVSKNKVLSTLLKADNIKEWNYKTSESYLIRKEGDSIFYIYMYNDLPWPILNRDSISKLTVIQENETVTRIKIEAVNETMVEEKNNVIRMKIFEGFWLIEEFDDYVKITQQMYAKPEGSIPNFIINSTLVSAPFNTFLKLREVLSK